MAQQLHSHVYILNINEYCCLPTTHVRMFIVALFKIASPKLKISQMFISSKIDKWWHSHTMEYSSALRNKVLGTATWMNLIDIVLSERIQTQNNTYCVIILL